MWLPHWQNLILNRTFLGFGRFWVIFDWKLEIFGHFGRFLGIFWTFWDFWKGHFSFVNKCQWDIWVIGVKNSHTCQIKYNSVICSRNKELFSNLNNSNIAQVFYKSLRSDQELLWLKFQVWAILGNIDIYGFF